eukprot:10379-Amorphochlora_amoeboformis.AAC.1
MTSKIVVVVWIVLALAATGGGNRAGASTSLAIWIYASFELGARVELSGVGEAGIMIKCVYVDVYARMRYELKL